MTFGFIFVTFAENPRSKRCMLILNTINVNHADFVNFNWKNTLKRDCDDFRFWGPPGEAPEQDAATKCASESQLFIGRLHDLR